MGMRLTQMLQSQVRLCHDVVRLSKRMGAVVVDRLWLGPTHAKSSPKVEVQLSWFGWGDAGLAGKLRMGCGLGQSEDAIATLT